MWVRFTLLYVSFVRKSNTEKDIKIHLFFIELQIKNGFAPFLWPTVYFGLVSIVVYLLCGELRPEIATQFLPKPKTT